MEIALKKISRRSPSAPGFRGAAKRSTITIGTGSDPRIRIKTDTTLFLWSTWLAAWIEGACAQRQRRTKWRIAILQLLPSYEVLVYNVYDLYDQLTPVKTRYLLISITKPGLMFRAHRGLAFFQI